MSRRKQWLVGSGLAALIVLCAAWMAWYLRETGFVSPRSPSPAQSVVSVPAQAAPPAALRLLTDNETRSLMAEAERLGSPGNIPSLDRLKADWRVRLGAGKVAPAEFLAWCGLCAKLQDAVGSRELAAQAWTVLVGARPAKDVTLRDLAEALRLSGNPLLTKKNPLSARVREVLAAKLGPELDAASLNQWIALRSSLSGLKADDNEAAVLLNVIADPRIYPADLSEAACRGAGLLLQTPRGRALLAEQLDDEAGMINLSVAKVFAWERRASSSQRDDDIVLRAFVHALEVRAASGPRGDAEAMAQLGVAYSSSLILMQKGRRGWGESYRTALAAAQSEDMVMMCLEEICADARDTARYDFALDCLASTASRLRGPHQGRIVALTREMSDLKAALPPPASNRP